MEETTRSDSGIRSFFDRWHVYALVIEQDYMAHRGIHRALEESLASSRKSPFSVLDLGCGDASVTAATLRSLKVTKYVGVDLSEVALEAARTNFVGAPFESRFLESDFSEYLASSLAETVDVLISGFAAHHLKDHEKQDFFSNCYRKLSDGGDLYLYDVFCRPGESRKQHHAAYFELLETTWKELSGAELASILEHIRDNDHPIAYSAMAELARAAGFSARPGPIYCDGHGFHCLCHFRKDVR